MKKNLLKTVLVAAACLFGAGQGWAQNEASCTLQMTYVDMNQADAAMGEIAAGQTARAGYNNITNGAVGFQTPSWNENKVTLIKVTIPEYDGMLISATLTAEVSGSSDSKRTTGWGVGYNNVVIDDISNLTYNNAVAKELLNLTTVGDVVWTSTKSATTFETKTWDVIGALENAGNDNDVTLVIYETAAAGGYIKNPSLTFTYADAVVTSTIKYVDGEGNEIKASREVTGVAGSAIELTADDKANIYSNDKKYIYVSDDAASKTLGEGVVVTLVFREAAIYNYAFSSNVGDWSVTGSNFEGEEVKVYYPRQLVIDGVCYLANGIDPTKGNIEYSKSVTLTQDNMVTNIGYTKQYDNVIFYNEGEDIYSGAYTGGAVRCSLGSAGRPVADQVVVTLSPGAYKIYAAMHCASKSGATFTYTVGGETVLTQTSAGALQINNDVEFTVTDAANLLISAEGSAAGLDWILITQSAAKGTINAEDGWTSFSAPVALDFTGLDVVPYVAVSHDTENKVVNLESVEGVLPANTGVLLKGAGDFTIPVATTEAPAISNNMLRAAAAGETIDGTAENIYLFGKLNGVQAFYHLTIATEAPRGVAYLVVPAAMGKPAKIGFNADGETSGIDAIEAENAEGVIYNFGGQRIYNANKGLMIIDGKKVMK